MGYSSIKCDKNNINYLSKLFVKYLRAGVSLDFAFSLLLIYLNHFSYRSSFRQLLVYSVENLGSPLHTHNLDNSPAILIPYYDEGTSTVFLTGRVCIV